jgi:ABC-type transport system involved in multi-copper enzyme maturation permease subunit
MALFFYSQLGEFNMVKKPQPGQGDYGITYSEDENFIMTSTVGQLVLEYHNNRYATYPIGFYKQVSLSGNKFSKMSKIVSEVTGLSEEELKKNVEDYLSDVTADSQPLSVTPAKGLTYERFLALMKQADKLLGGGSNYSRLYMKSNAQIPRTYEQALTEYDDILKKDRLSGAYARLFCDYMGILLAILPVFIAVTRGLRDRRAKAAEVIYSHRASSLTVIAARYLSMLVMMVLPVFLLSIYPLTECIINGNSIGITVDYAAFLKYTLGWLTPTIMVSLSVGVFLTELTESALAILVMGIWWIISLFTGIANMQGGYGLNLIPRHNTLGNYQEFIKGLPTLELNRIAYTVLALLLAAAAVIVYDWKRKGRLNAHGKIFKHRKSKLKA